MLLKRVRLKNIRSYSEEEVVFPEGSVLLSGDIGSGKSTILLAIEFALFGIVRGEFSGNSLLRNGANNGFVELEFELDKNSFTIKRSLKRTKSAIEQDSGYIVSDKGKKLLTAQELKAVVLDLFGYPKNSANKNLLYRYTVYTPQEEMKRILLENPEERLSVLRKVFDIDKYKRIQDNSGLYAKYLREQIRFLESNASDLPEKKKFFEEKQIELRQAVVSLGLVESELFKINLLVAEKSAGVQLLEKQFQESLSLRQELFQADAHLNSTKEQFDRVSAEKSGLDLVISRLKSSLSQIPSTNLKSQISNLTNELAAKEKRIRELAESTGAVAAHCQIAEKKISEIQSLAHCPLCLQEVPHVHKERIIQEQAVSGNKLSQELERLKQEQTVVSKSIQDVKLALQQLQEQEKQDAIALEKFNALKEKEQKCLELANLISGLSLKQNSLLGKKEELAQKLSAFAGIDSSLSQERESFKVLAQQQLVVSKEQSRLFERKQQLSVFLASLETDIRKKEESQKRFVLLKELQDWLVDYFTNLVSLMEKQVFALVYNEFNERFQFWFQLLVADDVLRARINEEFTPLIEQNGYDIEFDCLSGGERTACALAYRLALTKVINEFVSSIRTKDLLVLDEPTDGFSEAQLERMRQVIDQLNLRQIIIVSHEQLMEGFVSSTVRIEKNEHFSKVSK